MAFSTDAHDAFGKAGEACLPRFLDRIRAFFQAVPPDALPTTFVFAYRVTGSSLKGLIGPTEGIATSVAVDSLAGHKQRMETASVVLVEVKGDGHYELAAAAKPPPLEPLSEVSLVFVNENGVDRFIIGGKSKTMPKLTSGARSNFAVATVAELDEALEKYRQVAADVSCPILAKAWEEGRHGPRLVFRNKPEATMRESLHWFLSVKVEGVTVRPEHNTDESKPVDLIVDWFGSKQRALIEIKWLGRSLTKESDGTQFTSYGPARAHEGANQLEDYLDREQSSDPSASLRGYVVVFDGRRRNVIDPTTAITETDACYYRDKDVFLEAKHQPATTRITALIRYFLEPRVSLFASPD